MFILHLGESLITRCPGIASGFLDGMQVEGKDDWPALTHVLMAPIFHNGLNSLNSLGEGMLFS